VNVAREAGQRDLVMQMRRRGNGDGVKAFGDQRIQILERAAARQFGRAGPVRRQRIDDPDQRGIRQAGQHAGMIGTHHTRPDHPDAQRAFGIGLRGRSGFSGTHIFNLGIPANIPVVLLARRHKCGECCEPIPDTF
jgi:hypothetical protein